jgi:hypothetical protein
MQEQWKSLPEYPEVEVSNLGNTRKTTRHGKLIELKQSWCQRQRYKQVNICTGKKAYVHRLVCGLFNHNPEPEQFGSVLHRNNDCHDNRAENLYWGNQYQNMQDRFKAGGYAKGEDTHQAKLTNEQVREIKRQLRKPYWGIGTRLAEAYGVHLTVISWIKMGRSWKHIK